MSDPGALTLSPYDRDIAIRTILGEAGDQGATGQTAVASVIRNRHAAGFADSASGVALQKGQFEPWGTAAGRARLQAIDSNSSAYKQAGDILDNVYSGQATDPTKGATHFYAPGLQSELDRKAPSWTNDYQHTATIGGHVFYQDPKYADILGAGGNIPASPASAAPSQPSPFATAFGNALGQSNPGQTATGQNYLLSTLRPVQQQAAQFQSPGSFSLPNYASAQTPNIPNFLMQQGRQNNALAAAGGAG